MTRLRSLIVDDEKLARRAMRKLLASHQEVEIMGEASTVAEALALLAMEKTDVVFLDVQMRGETGFDLLEQVPAPLPRIVFVTAHDRYATDAFQHEAVHYLLKPVHPDHLAEALNRLKKLALHEAGVRPKIAHPAVLRSLGLTAREAEVLYWIAHGKSNPEIAAILRNAPGTVKKQVQSILDQLGVDSRVQAALLAVELLGLKRG